MGLDPQILSLGLRVIEQRRAREERAQERQQTQERAAANQLLQFVQQDPQINLDRISELIPGVTPRTLSAAKEVQKGLRRRQETAEQQAAAVGQIPGLASIGSQAATPNERAVFSQGVQGLQENLPAQLRAQALNALSANIVSQQQQRRAERQREKRQVESEIRKTLRLEAARQRRSQQLERAETTERAAEVAALADEADLPLRSAGAAKRLARLDAEGNTFLDPIFSVPVRGNETDARSAVQRASVISLIREMEAAAEEFAQKVGGTAFTGTVEEAKRLFGEADPIFARFTAINSQANLILAVARGGRQLTDFELQRIEEAFVQPSELRFRNGRLAPGARGRINGLKTVIAQEYTAPFGAFYKRDVVNERVRELMETRPAVPDRVGGRRRTPGGTLIERVR